jgi:ankyrin repeat protein/L-ascorbate metabolism protein UlaG (beta-lactamase superfamily)
MMRLLPAILSVLLLLSALPALAGEIHRAVQEGNADLVARLVQADSSVADLPDTEHQFANRPLHYAAEQGNVTIARILLDAGASVDGFDSDESTPLDVAALNRRPEVVDLLLARGADVNRRDKNGAYALSFAASGGDTLVIRRLLEAGSDLNFRDNAGGTLLHFAAPRDLRTLVRVVLDHGADPNVGTFEGETPLSYAASRGRTEIVRALLEAGADPSLPDSSGTTPLMSASWGGQTEIFRLMLEAGADPNAANDWGLTALAIAARNGNAEVARLLLEKGADPNHTGREGETILHAAVVGGSPETVDAVLAAHPALDPGESRWGWTPLHSAAVRGYTDIAEKLVRAGADPGVRDASGATPAEAAAKYGNKGVLAALAASGGSAGLDARRSCAADFRGLDDREAVVWYLGHSGFAVKTKKNLLVFDYFSQNRSPDEPGLCNGAVSPDEIKGEKVTVFASHEHADHLDPDIYEWNGSIKDLAYVFGCRANGAPPFELMGPRETRKVHGMKITTIESSDPGVGFVVEVDGMTIFHAGDHANRAVDFSIPFKEEIDWLASKGVRPDLMLMPIRGCGLGDPEAVKAGVHYAIETLRPFAFVPMHAVDAENAYREFIDECAGKFPETSMYAVQHKGDRFRYDKGKIS